MNALDFPVEALALNYLRYGLLTVVNNIWMWVAVITAAVSFFTIKASSAAPRGKTPVRVISSPVERVLAAEPVETSFSSCPSSCKTTEFCALEREGSTKGKFTLYYNICNDDDIDDNIVTTTCKDGDSREVNGGDGGGVAAEGWWDRWENVMKMRMGDEWYHFQDLKIVNGSVVRLWDGCRKRNAIRCVHYVR